MKILNTIDNRNNLEVEEKHKRDEVLEYENIIFNIVKQKQEGNEYQRALSQSRTLQNQKENQFKLKEFKKIMNSLQDESICNKNRNNNYILNNPNLFFAETQALKSERNAPRCVIATHRGVLDVLYLIIYLTCAFSLFDLADQGPS